jgi:hypothetical protein
MIVRLLCTGAVALAAGVSGAEAASNTSGPSRPIPYPQLEAYLAASPQERASRDWWSGGASTRAADPQVGDGRTLPAATSPALESGPQSNAATAESAARAGTLDTSPPAAPTTRAPPRGSGR